MTQKYPYDPDLAESSLLQDACEELKVQDWDSKYPDKALRMREALLSSRIEGYPSTMQELGAFLLDEEKPPSLETRVCANCYHGLALGSEVYFQEQGKIDNLLIWGMHRELFRDNDHMPKGKYRDIKVWIGDYIPPHPAKVPEHMEELLEYIETTDDHMLIKAGITHAQYENIHPFQDGNGRTGRMLLSLLVGDWISPLHPHIWDSDTFWSRQQKYYKSLRTTNNKNKDFTKFLKFYLTGLTEQLQAKKSILRNIANLPEIPEEILQDPFASRETLEAQHGIQETEEMIRDNLMVPSKEDKDTLVYLPLINELEPL